MSRHINEKTAALIPLAEPRKPLSFPAAAFLICSLAAAAPANAAPPFDRSQFNKITFSGDCAQKQWILSQDNSLELILGPSPRGRCEAALEFHFPQIIAEETALRFQAQHSARGLSLRIGVQEDPGGPVVYSPSARTYRHWEWDAARLNYLKEGWAPRRVSSLRFVVDASPTSRWGTVTLRRIKFVLPSAPASQGIADVPRDAQAPAFDRPVETPLTPSKSKPSGISPRVNAISRQTRPGNGWDATPILLAAAGLLGLTLTIGAKPRRKQAYSPLYEINTRTWKTYRDAHEVVQFGGFNKITSSDLKGIKQGGFNAIWLMGIWEIGAKARTLSKSYSDDFHGSPYAIFDYRVSGDLGTEPEFLDLIRRAHQQRLSVIIDFVPNHMGLDSAWLNDHPEYFIHRVLDAGEAGLPEGELKQRYPGYFPYHTPSYPQGTRRVPKTVMVAYGKDPYFYPWIDTAQLDYAHPGLRRRMIELLSEWAKIVDGVRCDMAMLVLRDQVKKHRHPEMPWETFNQLMPGEFWTEAIQAVKRVNPNFIFMAETYWAMEGNLQQLGFDYTYNKPLYEAVCNALHTGHGEGLMNFLRLLGTDFLQKSVHFLENHDEERAMNALGEERQRAAATLLCTLPGIALLHQGQLEGKRERLPVQRVVPLHRERAHPGLHRFYQGLLRATTLPVFQEGRLNPLYSNNPALVNYSRVHGDTQALIIINVSQERQGGTICLQPGLRLSSGISYRFNDLFFKLKSHKIESVEPFYVYSATNLINKGLYVELDPFDAHVFVVEPQGAQQVVHKLLMGLRLGVEQSSRLTPARR